MRNIVRTELRLAPRMVTLLLLSMCVVAPALSQTESASALPQATGDSQPVISLAEALKRAEENEPGFAAANAEAKAAQLEKGIAGSALLPGVIYHNQALYTQPNGSQNQAGQGTGSQPSPRFIANNAVREYASQAVVQETLGFAGLADYKRASAEAARALAEREIARRGLVATVVELYFGAQTAAAKLAVAKRASAEANDFLNLTNKREQGREAAHADVVKASLETQQRGRDVQEAILADEKARLGLGVLLFADPRTPFLLVVEGPPHALPELSAVEAAAAKNNPEVRSALAALQAANAEVTSARAGYLPDLGLNFTYGIDAPQFAVNGPDHVKNLGYSAYASLDIPIWNWLATHRRVQQSEIRRQATQVALTHAQRQLLADLDQLYHEAETASAEQDSLEQSVRTARESLRLSRLRYEGGEGSVLEVVDAQTAMIAAETAQAEQIVRYRVAMANLEMWMGTL